MKLRWILLVIFMSVVVADSNGSNNGIFGNFLQALKNLLPLTAGGLEFIRDFVNFAKEELIDITPKNNEEYDFIVVGAGSGGATIASRLTENPRTKVLLIEAGYVEHLIMDIPLLGLYLQLDKNLQWEYITEPSDKYCRGIENNQCKIPFGKVMGGTSIINFMMATRGNRRNYDRWAEETGDSGWSYNELEKYFKKLERLDVNLTKINPENHNFDGPVRIADVPYRSPFIHGFIEAGKEMKFPSPIDYNSGEQTGFAYLQTSQVNGERLTVNRAYLHPAKNRKNLFVSMNSHVNKVLIDPQTKTAYGVEFTKNNRKMQVRAKKEVILSAGALGTPKILMLSGIGPAEHLRSFNINVLKDAPVGENLMDHIAYGGLTFLVNVSKTLVASELLKPSNPALSEYLTKRKGPLTTPVGPEGLMYFNTEDPTPQNDDPNIEIVLGNIHMAADLLIHQVFGIKEDYFWKTFGTAWRKQGYLLWPILIQPKSRGKVQLRSADPQAKPKVIANYFSHPEDVQAGIKGIRKAIEISKTNAMRKFESRMQKFTVPGCEKYQPDSDEYWECAFRTYTMTVWHHCGTSKMGRENDPSAVVNSKLQVIGIKNLRVGDASVIPLIPAAHLNIPTIMVAEKLSDIIKSYWIHDNE